MLNLFFNDDKSVNNMSLLDDEKILLNNDLECLKKTQLRKIKKFCYSYISGTLYDYLFEKNLYKYYEKNSMLKPRYKLKLEWDEKQYKYYFVPEDSKRPGLMRILNIDSIKDIPDYIRVKNVKFILD